MSKLQSNNQSAISIKCVSEDEILFSREVKQSSLIETYTYYNAIVVKNCLFNNIEFTLQYQNGQSYHFNDYDLPKNDFFIDESNNTKFIRHVNNMTSLEIADISDEDFKEVLKLNGCFITSKEELLKLYEFICDECPKFEESDYETMTCE